MKQVGNYFFSLEEREGQGVGGSRVDVYEGLWSRYVKGQNNKTQKIHTTNTAVNITSHCEGGEERGEKNHLIQ